MTQDQKKDLLLKDLCARMPYGVKVKFKVNEVIAIENKITYVVDGEYSYITDGKSYLILDIIKALFNNYLDEIKPYLFPLSSMTKEQNFEYLNTCMGGNSGAPTLSSFDWLHKNHFDYRGLIEKGLALDATGLNIY